MENFIEKIIKDAEEKRNKIIKEAENELKINWEKQKEIIDKEYNEKLIKMKKEIK